MKRLYIDYPKTAGPGDTGAINQLPSGCTTSTRTGGSRSEVMHGKGKQKFARGL